MARRTSQVEEVAEVLDAEDIDETLVTTAPDDWDFEVIADESPIRAVFSDIGDTFVGQYEGVKTITPENGDDPFDLFLFRARDERLYAVNSSHKLVSVLNDDLMGMWVKLEYVKDIPSKKGNPMKDFKISVKR